MHGQRSNYNKMLQTIQHQTIYTRVGVYLLLLRVRWGGGETHKLQESRTNHLHWVSHPFQGVVSSAVWALITQWTTPWKFMFIDWPQLLLVPFLVLLVWALVLVRFHRSPRSGWCCLLQGVSVFPLETAKTGVEIWKQSHRVSLLDSTLGQCLARFVKLQLKLLCLKHRNIYKSRDYKVWLM